MRWLAAPVREVRVVGLGVYTDHAVASWPEERLPASIAESNRYVPCLHFRFPHGPVTPFHIFSNSDIVRPLQKRLSNDSLSLRTRVRPMSNRQPSAQTSPVVRQRSCLISTTLICHRTCSNQQAKYHWGRWIDIQAQSFLPRPESREAAVRFNHSI